MHVTYPKIYSIYKEDCDWILDWEVYIQEKIDWANFSIWYDDWICMWSRTQIVYSWWVSQKEFRNAQSNVLWNIWILSLINDHKNYRLFWEYLVKHTINYPEEHYNKFYLFDILDWETWLDIWEVYKIAEGYWILTPKLIYKWVADIELVKSFVWQSSLTTMWEWVVIKNMNFINKFYNRQYAKIVREEFKEQNSIVFWNCNKAEVELKFATTYITEWRVRKIVNKIEQNEERKLRKQDTPKVLWMVYHDAITENIRDYAWKKTIDFEKMRQLCSRRSRYLFHNMLDNATSDSDEVT